LLLSATITTVPTKIVSLLSARGQARERYAGLRNRARTQAAHDLIEHIRGQFENLEQTKRTNKRRAKSRAKLANAIERFIGDCFA
jgi:hypothetical protein